MPSLRVIFMGSPDFAVPSLEALVAAGHDIACVYAQPPRPAGRGHRERPCPVHAAAEARGLAVRTPVSLKVEGEQAAFRELGADVAVVVAYGLLLPKPVLDAPRLGCVNVHASLLPRWRGAAPIQRAILAGDDETGVSVMRMEEGLDTGAVYLTRRVPITGATTAQALHDALARIGASAVCEALDGIAAGTLAAEPQPEAGVTYAAKLGPDEGRLDWARPAAELDRVVRALNPWPGVWFEHAGERIKVLAAVPDENGGAVTAAPGTVLDEAPRIACGEGALHLVTLQRPGKKPQEAGAFLRGYGLPPGTVLG